ncbi:alpha/beta fold hydrolase [Abyssisolibacter fermentans]|uniref:alpha/beta fold hydrolase n=1 Tax=Abyssisolibacter fermentans TaxID=1766203 RepID=UPI000831A822|nr:alpha/beta hydrolase [Abyssisolibacter fermentans]
MGLIILFIFGLFTISTIINCICCKLEIKKLNNCYGKFVQINEEKMCVDISGSGNKVVVLLTGWCSPSPVLEMAPLREWLKDEYMVITIEYYGYGLSDITKKERTIENITEEIHCVLQSLGYSRYTFMAHSISGVYGLYYANQYPEEVEAFVGIDTSVPKQNEYMNTQKLNLKSAYISIFEKNIGILRIASKISSRLIVDDVKGFIRSKEDTKLLIMLYLNKWFNKTVINEQQNSIENFKKCKYLKFPKEIPVLFFLSSKECEKLKQWYILHEEIITDKKRSKIVILEGSHFLHYYYSLEIINIFKKWIEHPLEQCHQPKNTKISNELLKKISKNT